MTAEGGNQKVLIVVDMQNDFITGPLGNEECRAVVPEVVDAILNGGYDSIFVTMDTHDTDYLSTQEGRNLPVEHCIKGSEGWELVPEVKEALDSIGDFRIIRKSTFGSMDLAQQLRDGFGPRTDVDLIGVCTDICVISNAMVVKSACPEMRVTVISKACAGTSKEAHVRSLAAMQSCQIRVI